MYLENIIRSDLAERTAFVYLTEISHLFAGRAYAYGGGVFHTAYSDRIDALVGSTLDKSFDPVDPQTVREGIDALIAEYL